jgi:hypothetical protein
MRLILICYFKLFFLLYQGCFKNDLIFILEPTFIFIEYHSFSGQEQFLPELLGVLKSAGFRLNINAPGLTSMSPFMKLNEYNGMDMQLNIYGMRKINADL